MLTCSTLLPPFVGFQEAKAREEEEQAKIIPPEDTDTQILQVPAAGSLGHLTPTGMASASKESPNLSQNNRLICWDQVCSTHLHL